jgi:hypothetical protein
MARRITLRKDQKMSTFTVEVYYSPEVHRATHTVIADGCAIDEGALCFFDANNKLIALFNADRWISVKDSKKVLQLGVVYNCPHAHHADDCDCEGQGGSR